jgi:hypothetical protein
VRASQQSHRDAFPLRGSGSALIFDQAVHHDERPLDQASTCRPRNVLSLLALSRSGSTLYHWAAIVLPLGYTVSEVYNGGGNPYGTSYVTEGGVHGGPNEHALSVARAQGRRLTQGAGAIASARELGLLEARAGVIRDPLGATGGRQRMRGCTDLDRIDVHRPGARLLVLAAIEAPRAPRAGASSPVGWSLAAGWTARAARLRRPVESEGGPTPPGAGPLAGAMTGLDQDLVETRRAGTLRDRCSYAATADEASPVRCGAGLRVCG